MARDAPMSEPGAPPPATVSRPGLAGRIALVVVFVAALAAFFALGGPEWVGLATLKRYRDTLLLFADAHFVAAMAIGYLAYTTAVAFSFPGAVVLSLAMGFVFGRWVGTALIVAAATTGATLAFVAARYLFAAFARRRLGALGERINAGFTANAFSYLLFLRLVPVFPFFLVNLAPAFTTVPLRTYVLATFLGIIPGTFVFANLGQALARLDSLHDVLSPGLLGGLGLLALLALVPMAVRKLRGRRARAA